MRSIRRLYFYAVTLISVEVVLWGLIGLLRSIFSSELIDTTDVLAQALALVLVGLPIFLFHWLWIQRTVAKDEEERDAGLRAIFFYGILLGTLVPVVQNTLALINRTILGISNISYERAFLGGFQTWQDNLIAIFINALVALYFWNTLQKAWETLNDTESFADVRRLYRYLWLLYSLLMVVFGAQQILRFVFYLPVPKSLLGEVGREMFANGLTLLLVGTPLWVYIWRICQNSLTAPAEQASNLRLGVLYLLALGGVITVLSAGGTFLDIILRWAFGESMQGYEIVRDIGGPISLGVPFAAVWAYYGSWLKRQIDADNDLVRRAGKKRFYSYILSALGLGASFIGVSLVLSFIIDLSTANEVWGNTLRPRLTGAIATLAVGLPLWLRTWRPMQAQALSERPSTSSGQAHGDHARRSTIRRVYLYLALFAGVIGGMVTAVGLVDMVIRAFLNQDFDSSFLARVLNMLQMLVLFVVLLVYHWISLRRDGKLAGQTLETLQREFPVLLIDPGDEAYIKTVTAALSKHAPDVPILIQPVGKLVKGEAKAALIPAALALNPPIGLRKWLDAFEGEKIVIGEASSGWVLTALSPEQAAKSARQVAEGEQVRLNRPSVVWETIKIIAVVLLGIQILFFLFVMAIELFT